MPQMAIGSRVQSSAFWLSFKRGIVDVGLILNYDFGYSLSLLQVIWSSPIYSDPYEYLQFVNHIF